MGENDRQRYFLTYFFRTFAVKLCFMSEINEDDIFNQNEDPTPTVENYDDNSIVHLEDMEHIRRRPGM